MITPDCERLRYRWWAGTAWCLLLGGLLAACQGAPVAPAAVTALPVAAPLPPALRQLLYPLPTNARADRRRQRAALPRWAGDSLGQLLLHSRLGVDYQELQQPDSAQWHWRQAWRLASPTLRRQQPAEVFMLASVLSDCFQQQAAVDSAIYYQRLAIGMFRAAGLDSTHNLTASGLRLPTNHAWLGGVKLASVLANMGSLLRQAGQLTAAFRYYEQAAVLYQQLRAPRGELWAQCLLGEAYAEQGDAAQASAAYERALGIARTLARPAGADAFDLAGVLLDWYQPVLVSQPRRAGEARQLAEEVTRTIERLKTPAQLASSPHFSMALGRLALLQAELSLRAGQPAGPELARAERWIRQFETALRRSHRESDYDNLEAVRGLALGLRAWQQHATNPAAARQLLARAAAQLPPPRTKYPWGGSRQQLAGYALAMGEPAAAIQLLQPLAQFHRHRATPFALSQIDGLLTRAYAAAGRYDSAYAYALRSQALTDTLRAARQFAALAATEARYRTREQASQIRLLTARGQQARLRMWLAGVGAVLLALALLAVGLGWWATRRLNQRLAAQGQLLQAQANRLGELDKAKNQFFANVSHELRTPLTLVLGPLSQALGLALPPPLHELLAISVRHGQRLRGLIDRILDLTKLEAGKLEAQPVPTQLAALLRDLVTGFEPLAATGRVALHGPAGLPEALTVRLDAEKVTQILTNLLANALQHTPAGGQVRLLVAQPGPGQYAFTVQDTGPGIAPVEQAQVFERFYQSPQRQARGGTGLGLALSRELATLLGGTLTLASEPGLGATFTLTLPAAQLPPAAPAKQPIGPAATEAAETALVYPSPPAGLRPRVLLVEDETDLRVFVRSLLVPAYEVLEAADGHEALALLACEPVTLVVSDAMMPRFSGLELLQQLKADPAYQGLPFLMLTARADEAHRLTALATGVDDYLLKPFEAPELLARVAALLHHQQTRRHYQALASEPPGPAEGPVASAGAAPRLASPAARPTEAAAMQLARWQAQVAAHLPDEHFGPAELAALLCLSERTLYRRLGELAGFTPAAWLRELRLHYARHLLETGQCGQVAEVAEAAGFANAKYFSSCYAERFGRRPSTYYK